MSRHASIVGSSIVAVVLVAAGLVGCSSSSKTSTPPTTTSPPAPAEGAVPWPAPPNAMAQARAAGLAPKGFETLQHHVHAHLDVFVNGEPQVVPAGIGINIKDPAVHTFGTGAETAYGGINPPCAKPCISPLHTHAVSGVLHTESPTNVDNTLEELFTEWDVTLNDKCVGGYCEPTWDVAWYVNGEPFTGDPRQIALTNQKEIALVIGSPPAEIPSTADFTVD